MKERYRVLHIYEDDFGCEERCEDHEAQVIVIVKDTDGNELPFRQADAWLYEQDINEGDEVSVEEGKLIKKN